MVPSFVVSQLFADELQTSPYVAIAPLFVVNHASFGQISIQSFKPSLSVSGNNSSIPPVPLLSVPSHTSGGTGTLTVNHHFAHSHFAGEPGTVSNGQEHTFQAF